jgi:citrate lyase subunit beta/citryl-CoA lyase
MLMRSKLFVPGSRPELYAKAFAGDADGLSFDLEDAVAEARKSEARQSLQALFDTPEAARSGKIILVRVNAPDTPHFAPDLDAVVREGVHFINVPKMETPRQVQMAAAAIEQAERRNGVAHPVKLLLNIETPAALLAAAELARAHERVAGLQLGLGDLFEPLGIARRENTAIGQAMFQLRMAAGAAGVFAYDSAYANIGDQAGYREEAALARRLGFLGKTCIHPSQVALANAAFLPDAKEIDHALRVIQASAEARAQGVGAYVVDGRMIDAPFERRAEAVVELARRLGLVSSQ